MAKVTLIEGPVGAGKTTFAAKLGVQRGVPRLDLDEWMVSLFSPDRPETGFMPWYQDRKERCLEQIWRIALELLDADHDVILELGLVQLLDREEFYARVDGCDHDLEVFVLDVPFAERKARVMRRNDEQGMAFKMAVSEEIFQIANAAWQPPDEIETRDRNIQVVTA
ncbi:MAG: AAA family ATPase [Pseudomonadales bacterium]|nr:AAA family ATPase [Pseudomonadales bacterium]